MGPRHLKPGDFKIPFGKYEGQRLDKIAETDAGLKYLDWLRDHIVNSNSEALLYVRAYLKQDGIARELERVIGG